MGNPISITFKPAFRDKFTPSAQKIAVLVSNEFEGITKNGGIGTYYTTLSNVLATDDWTVILLLCQTEIEYRGDSYLQVQHVFSTYEIPEILTLQSIHHNILHEAQQYSPSQSFADQSLRCLFFIQALTAEFPDAVVYTEFPEIWGFGYHTIQAKQSGLLNHSCFTGVMSHGSFEWLREINSQYETKDARWFWQAHHYEQFSYENADITYSPSHFLRGKVASYGWKTHQVKHLPYFVPIVQPFDKHENDQVEGLDPIAISPTKIPVVFFGRLEERKGFCLFIEALKLLDVAIASKIHPIFMGKIIPLQSSHLQHLNSQQYIDRELNNSFTHTLLPDLNSQEAIQAIAQLQNPIVCLTSLQENFPNAALEVGQLPVSLIVSDTAGFCETLDLLQRKEAVHWFQPGNVHALAQALMQAIRVYPENPTAIEQTAIADINRHLLNQRLELMSQAFLEAAPKEPITPSVTVALICWHSAERLLECLTSLAAQTYEHLDVTILFSATDQLIQSAIAEAQTQFPNYRYLTSEADWSLGATYNDLVDQSTSEYLLFLTPSHILMPTTVEKLIIAVREANADVVVCPQQFAAGEQSESIRFVDGNLLKLLEWDYRYDLTALFSRKLLQQFRYSQERSVRALHWQIFAAAIATDQAIAYYPYPLYTIHPDSAWTILATDVARERYYLRQYLLQIKPEQWHQRQINLLLNGFGQQVQPSSSPVPRPSSPQDQAWMITAQQLHQELTDAQTELTTLKAWNQSLQTGKDWLESQWQAWMLKAQKVEAELDQGRSLIQQMQGSKLWKLRRVWLKLKRKLGRISNDPLRLSPHIFTPGVQEFVTRVASQKIRFFQATAIQTPIVSVISPCFQKIEYFETTYRSIINQTLQNIEWIIVDDGSTQPEIQALLASLSQRTEKIRVLSHATHQGTANSYNAATIDAKSGYLCFVEIGHIFDPTYLEKCVLLLETHPHISFVNSYSVVFQAREHWWQPCLNEPASLLQQEGLISHPVYRKADFDQLGGFDNSYSNFTDWERSLKAIASGQQGWTIPEYLDCYRSTLENAPVITQFSDHQQVIHAIRSRYQSVNLSPSVTSLESPPLKLETLNYRVNIDNQRTIPNSNKRILLFCDALDDSQVAQWNCDWVIWLDKCGYDVTIVTTSSTSDHFCQEFFYKTTPDIFHLSNLLNHVDWVAFIRYLLQARQIDSIFISGSELAYSFLPLLRIEYPKITLIDHVHSYSDLEQSKRAADLSQQFLEDLDGQIVPSQRMAKNHRSLNSVAYDKTKACYTLPEVEATLANLIQAHRTTLSTPPSVEAKTEALLLILES